MRIRSIQGAPARRLVRAGAFVLIPILLTGCERGSEADDAGPRVLELANDTIRLAEGVRLVDIAVERSASGDFDPAEIDASAGDYVRFTARDNAGHAVLFDAAALAPEAAEYLERTGQMRGPPLIERGAAWVIALDGAPSGEYIFRCATHDAAGRLNVRAR